MAFTSIFTEDYLRKRENKLNDLTGKYAKIHNYEQISKMETETEKDPKIIQPAENMDTKDNERPPESTGKKDNGHKRTQQVYANVRKLYHDKIGMDQQKIGQVMLFLGHCDINQIYLFLFYLFKICFKSSTSATLHGIQ